MDIFDLDRHVIDEYQGFARSFVKIESADLREQIDQIYAQNAFWPDPYVSLNPNYQKRNSIQQLADDGVLAPDTARVFRDEKGELGGDHAAARPGARHSHKHLTLLKQQNLIDEWHDRRIAAGGERYHSGDDRDVTGRPVLVASDLRSRISEVNERTSAAAAGLLAVIPVTACEVDEEIEPTERARAEDR